MFNKVRDGTKKALTTILGFGVLVIAFLIWGYLHQMFSSGECDQGGPDMSLGAIVASGFGMTICTADRTMRDTAR
jgi:hypothetical protein